MYAMKFLILFLYSFSIKIDGVESNLKYVFKLDRVAARSPVHQVIKKRDILGLKWGGSGEVTDRGLRQSFLNGLKMRLRYVNDLKFLSSSFRQAEMELQSTNSNRTIGSANSFLIGLYPPYTGQFLTPEQTKHALPPVASPDLPLILNSLEWAALPSFSMVFPVQIFAKVEKYFDLQSEHVCKGVEPIIEKNKKKRKITDFQKKFDNKYGYIKKILKFSDDYFSDYDNLIRFCDAINCANFDKRNLSFLYVNSTVINQDCEEFLKLDLYDVKLFSENNYITNMAMTPIMKKFIGYLDSLISLDNKNLLDSSELPKFTHYAAYSENVALYMHFFSYALKTNKKLEFIPPSSNILLEFHKLDNSPSEKEDTNYVIHIYYNEEIIYNDTYKKFKKAIKPFVISNSQIDDFCEFNDNSGLYYMIAIGLLGSVSLGLGLWILLLLFKSKPVDPLLPQ